MKKLSIIVTSIIALGASAAAVAAPDIVKGAGRFGPADDISAKVEISAKSDPDGQNATGHFSLRQGATVIHGEITCLAVDGNRAAAGGTMDVTGTTFVQVTRDNGQGQDEADESQTLIGADPALCADYVNFDPSFDVDRGNYVVKDRD